MVQKKNQKNWLESWIEEHEKRKRDNPIIKTVWYVVEITPSYRYATGDGHGGTDYEWSNTREDRVSPEFDTRKDAEAWMNEHEPDHGKILKIDSVNLRRFTEDRWVTW